jgi:hypothetical protein
MVCLLYLAAMGIAQPYEPTFLYDETSVDGHGLGLTVLAPLGDQDEDGYDDVLMTVWDGPDYYYHLRVLYGGDAPPYRTIDFGYANIDTSSYIYMWRHGTYSACGDYNNDSHIDIMVELYNVDFHNLRSAMFLYLGGPEFFDTLWDWRTLTPYVQGCHGSIGDYDGNSQADYILGSTSSQYDYFEFFSGTYPNMPQDPTWQYSPPSGFGDYWSSHGFGDINGDNWPDFTYPRWEPTGPETGYPIYEFWLGGPGADSLPDIALEYNEWDESARGWRIIGDVNGDGFDDLLACNCEDDPGIPEIYYGGDPLDLEESDAFLNYPDWYFLFTANNEASGVANLGDINNDGCDDIAFHCWSHPGGGGYIHVFLGGNPMDPDVDFSILHYFDGDYTPGFRVDRAGDFNGDGIDDWMFSSRISGPSSGRVTVVAGDEQFGQSVPQGPPTVAEDFKLGTPYPNPFNSEVTIPLEIEKGPKLVDIRIYNILGQEVRVFGNVLYTAGQHRIVWDGKSNTGESVTTGQYFVQATVGEQIATAAVKMVR